MNNRRRRFHFWFLLLIGVFVWADVGSRAGAEEDPLSNLWTTSADEIRQQILRTAGLPGGESVRKLADGPVLLWVERCFVGTDNVYSNEGTRYAVLRLEISNPGTEELQIKRENITLRVGGDTFKLGPRQGLLRDMPLQIDWHEHGHIRPQSQLRTPKTIKVPAGKGVAFWCIFAGFDPLPVIPEMTLVVESESGGKWELDVNAQQNARLGLTSQRLGPHDALTVFTIHGQLNRINSVLLANEMTAASEKGGNRFVIEWTDDARPSDEVLLNWLLTSTMQTGEVNPLTLSLPTLPVSHQCVLSGLPSENEDAGIWGDVVADISKNTQDAVIVALKDIYERADPAIVLDEIRTGHQWSKVAALRSAGDRLPADALPLLLELSRKENSDERIAAILALGYQSQPSANAALSQFAQSKDETVARAAFEALLSTSNPFRRARVRELLKEGQVALPQSEILKLLAAQYHPDWNADLIQAIQSDDPEVRCVALKSFSQIGHADLNRFCREALKDSDEKVREQAFQILIDHPDRASEQAARDYALKRLNEGHVDDSILDFIETIRETRAAPALLAAMSQNERQRHRMIEVICEIGTSGHLQAILDGLDKYTEDEQVAALNLVYRLSVPTQLQAARKALTSDRAAMHDAAIEILKSVGNDEAVTILGDLLISKDPKRNVDLICMALGEIGTGSAIRGLREFQEQAALEDNHNGLRAAIAGLQLWRSRLPGFDYIQAGYIHIASQEEEEAIKSFSMAILINPDLSDAYAARGDLHLRKKEFAKAGNDFAKAMQLDRFNGQAITGVAIVGAINGGWKESADLVEANAKRFSADNVFLYNTACVYSRCAEALQKTPDSPERDEQITDFQKKAIDKLKVAIEEGFSDFAWMQKDPDLEAIRSLPNFKKLLTDDAES
ncbi:HEAT repeat domain-containing protein [Planctomicrobium sp. SH661]|uniref:HEAT repeat domain-containing protein n=1 Tax=Planctomicrobium sp. SH661 TaxID=3448124 RepID=UPI003F5B60D6